MTTATIEEIETGAADSAADIIASSIAPIDRFRDLSIGKRQESYPIDPRSIVVEDGFNPRDFNLPHNREELDKLKASILAMNGVQQPLWIRWSNKTPILIDGERRLRAVMELIAEGHPILSVPATQKTVSVSSVADRLYLAMTANEGLPLTQLEVGATYLRLVGFGHQVKDIATRAGKSERYVRDSIALADSPDAVKALVASGEVSMASALKEVKQDAEGATERLQSAVKENKAQGKGQVKAPKKDKKLSKLNQIALVMQEYEAFEETGATITKAALIAWMGDISDILEGN